ncbi:TPA: hypothetical protein I9Y37_001873 [Citrobacter freundii]|nr:hypothetical protein [Citrobacter freundii]HAT3963849.1 hypothetical protein [Citrobacter freundii]
MASINYLWGNVAGLVVFPPGTGIDDAAGYIINGSLSAPELMAELDEANHWNKGNLDLPASFSGSITPRQMMDAMGVLGWFVTPDAELSAALAAEDAAPEPPEDEIPIY